MWRVIAAASGILVPAAFLGGALVGESSAPASRQAVVLPVTASTQPLNPKTPALCSREIDDDDEVEYEVLSSPAQVRQVRAEGEDVVVPCPAGTALAQGRDARVVRPAESSDSPRPLVPGTVRPAPSPEGSDDRDDDDDDGPTRTPSPQPSPDDRDDDDDDDSPVRPPTKTPTPDVDDDPDEVDDDPDTGDDADDLDSDDDD